MSKFASILACNELLRLIVLELRPVYSSNTATPEVASGAKAIRQQARRDLASAARVCRAFTEHALDALWEVLDSLLPIFKVLPSFHNRPRRPLDLVSGISPDDWALLRSYGRRVKELRHPWSDVKCIGPCVLPILMASFHASGASLLPRLQRLRLPNLDAETTAYTIPLLSPTVQSVTVSFDVGTDPDDPKIKDRDNFEMFLSALRVASPSLQELVVFHQYRTFHMGKKHIDSMSGFAHLQHFSSTITLNPAAWSQLGSIRPLRHLDICIRSLDSPSNLEPGSHLENTDANLTPESYTLSLPNLHSAKVKGPLDTLAIFVDNLESPALRSLTFNVYSSPTPSVLGEFLDLAKEKLPRALRKLVLQSFSLRQPQSGPYEQAEPVDLQPLLPPLASLTGLEDLSLDFFEIPMYVSDDAIRTLADGLPTLVSLALRYKPPCYHRTAADPDAQAPDKRPTIGALVALANGCPHLAHLHIVDVDVDAETPHDCVVPALDHPLRELEITSFSSRTRGRVFGFAEKLHRIFPHLGDVRAHGACSGWNVAKEYLEYLQTV